MVYVTNAAYVNKALNVAAASGNTADITVTPFEFIETVINLSVLAGGTTPSVAFFIDEKDESGNYIQIYAFTAITAVNTPGRRSIGPGLETPILVTKIWRLRWATTGAPSTATAQVSLYGDVSG